MAEARKNAEMSHFAFSTSKRSCIANLQYSLFMRVFEDFII